MGKPKILVEITELDNSVHFKKCPVTKDGKVSIYAKGGRGLENPDLPKAFWEQKTLKGLGKKRYARYRRSSNKFMAYADDSLLPISIELVQELLNTDSYHAHFGDKKTPLTSYIILLGIAFIALMQILPYMR